MHAALTRKRGGLVRGFTDYDLYANVEIYLGVLNLILNRIEFFFFVILRNKQANK